MNTSNNNLKEFLLDKLYDLKEYVLRNLRLLLPIFVAVIAVIVFIVALVSHNKKVKENEAQEAAETAQQTQTDLVENTFTIPEVALELNQYPAVNELINKYYTALASGDVDTISSIDNMIDETESIRIAETAKYIDSYSSIDVYTKVGPTEGTYLAYVSSTVKFVDYEGDVPGMEAYYICTDESGNLYINEGAESEFVTNYIREVSLQDDVVDLNNEVAVAYNDMLAADENLAVFLVDLTETIDTSVGEALAQVEGTQSEETDETEVEETSEEQAITSEVVTRVKTTTTVNVRSSDSETADKLGKASAGSEYKLIEERGNGWSEIEYEGKSAFIKSEFLEAATTETIVTVPEKTIEESTSTAATESTTTTNSSSTKVTGTVTVKENVRIRSGASETSDKIATAYVGQKLDVIMKQGDGWTKIKYNGQIAYVKSEFVE